MTAVFHIFHGKFVIKPCKLFLLNSLQLHSHPFLSMFSETTLNQALVISVGRCNQPSPSLLAFSPFLPWSLPFFPLKICIE